MYYFTYYTLNVLSYILYNILFFMSHSIYYSHRRIREARCAHSLSGSFVFLLFLQFCSGSQNERRGGGSNRSLLTNTTAKLNKKPIWEKYLT